MSKRAVHDAEEQRAGLRRSGDAREWKVVAASVTGRAHTGRGQGNEDAIRSVRLANGTTILALADGAGSASRAAEGATLAVAAATEALSKSLAGESESVELSDSLLEAMAAVRRALAARVRELRPEARAKSRELSSTLLLAVLRGDTLGVLQIGDGAAVVGNRSGWRRITRPVRGRHAGETVFVTSRGATDLAEVEVCALTAGESLALLSDGLEPVATAMTSGEPHAPFFDPLVSFAGAERPPDRLEEELEEFLGSERVQSRSSDDLSLILAVRQENR